MLTYSLLLVLVLAKLLVLPYGAAAFPPWSALVWFGQDLLLAAVFYPVERFLSRAVAWPGYLVLVLYTAVNVPFIRVAGAPSTLPVYRGTTGAMADSFLQYASWQNLWPMGLVLAVAALVPLLLRGKRFPGDLVWLLIAGGVAGGWLAPKLQTFGLHRSSVVALARSAWPRLAARPAEGDWRGPAVPAPPELRALRGAAAGRDLLVVVLESAGAVYLRPHGADEDPMPNLTRHAASALWFEEAYCVYPESVKGLLPVFASTWPAMEVSAEAHARAAAPSLAHGLPDYRSGLFHSGRFDYLGMDAILAGMGFDTLAGAGEISGRRESSFGVEEEATVARLLDWVDGLEADERFFAAYLPVAGHHPYEPSNRGPFPQHEAIGRFRNALFHADRCIQALLDGLRERGRLEGTVVAVIGDHGQAFDQHPYNIGHAMKLYEENIRVPFFVFGPGIPARRVAGPVLNLDFAPTLLDLLGREIPPSFRGRSLLRAQPAAALFFTDYSLGLLGLREGQWKYIHELDGGRHELYDLAIDPGERRNLAGEHPGRVAAWAARLRTWSAAQRAALLERD